MGGSDRQERIKGRADKGKRGCEASVKIKREEQREKSFHRLK